jgi:hypothetical protein
VIFYAVWVIWMHWYDVFIHRLIFTPIHIDPMTTRPTPPIPRQYARKSGARHRPSGERHICDSRCHIEVIVISDSEGDADRRVKRRPVRYTPGTSVDYPLGTRKPRGLPNFNPGSDQDDSEDDPDWRREVSE